MKFLSVVEDLKDQDNPLHLQNKSINVKWVGRISGYLCPDTVFNLSHRVLNETEIKVLKKSLDYAPIRKETKQPKLRKDFSEFCRRIRNKWYFRNEPTLYLVRCHVLKLSSWRDLLMDLFDTCKKQQTYFNFNSDEWKAMRSLADDRNLVMKKWTRDLVW